VTAESSRVHIRSRIGCLEVHLDELVDQVERHDIGVFG